MNVACSSWLIPAPSPVIKEFLSFICKIAVLITADNDLLIMAFLINCSYHEIYCSGFVTSLLLRFAMFGKLLLRV